MPDLNKDIPLFPQACYEVDVFWHSLERHLRSEIGYGLELEPDFQRGHVWSEEQQIRYVEYVLRGGETSRTIIFNSPEFPKPSKDYVLIDGLQRMTAARKFMRSELPAFGTLYKDWEGHLRHYVRFQWRIITLPTRAAVLEHYLALNTAGTPHGEGEIRRVRKMLAEAKYKEKHGHKP